MKNENPLEPFDMTIVVSSMHLDACSQLLPAPVALEVLGQLSLLSSKEKFHDFPLQDPTDGYKHVRFPTSFRATLLQVSHAGRDAFVVAHSSMHNIGLLTKTIPDDISDILEIIASGSVVDQKYTLPDKLEDVERSAKECVKYAEKPLVAFTEVSNLLQEFLQSALSKDESYKQEVEKAKIDMEQAEIEKEKLQKAVEKLQLTLAKAENETDEAAAAYKQAIKDLPGTWKTIGLSVGDLIVSPLKLTGKLVDGVVGFLGGNKNVGEDVGENKIPGFLENIQKSKNTKITETKELLNRWQKQRDEEQEKLQSEEAKFTELLVKIQKLDIRKMDNTQILEFLREGLKLLGELESRWQTLVLYFKTLSSNVTLILGESTAKLVHHASKPKLEIGPTALKSLYRQGQTAITISVSLQIMADAYLELSSKHFLPMANNLSSLINTKNDSDIENEKAILSKQAELAAAEIKAIMDKNHNDSNEKVKAKLLAIQNDLQN